MYTTTLSGDLLGNDGPSFTYRTDNSYHVVKIAANAPNNNAPCVIDAVTIVGGYVGGNENYGGGIYAFGPVTLTRCIVRDNHAYYGGGLYIYKTCQASDCTFELNRAQYSGGAIEIASGALAQSFPQIGDMNVEINLFDKGFGPDAVQKVGFFHHPAIVFDKQDENVKGFRGQRYRFILPL